MFPTKTCSTLFSTTGVHFETDDLDVTVYIGPATNAEPLEIGVVNDEEGTAVIHAMPARSKFLQGWWSP